MYLEIYLSITSVDNEQNFMCNANGDGNEKNYKCILVHSMSWVSWKGRFDFIRGSVEFMPDMTESK